MITGYIVEQQMLLSNGTWSPLEMVYDGRRSLNQSAVIANLVGNTQYKFNVSAMNLRSLCFADGSEPPGEQLVKLTQSASVPSQPKRLVASNITGGSVTISWDLPLSNGGEAILGYSIFERSYLFDYTLVAYQNAAMARIRTVYGLSTFIDYQFLVCADNIAGKGANSSVLNVTTDYPTPPGAPKNLQQLPSASGGSIVLSWDPPDDTGGTSLQFYRISRNGTQADKIDAKSGVQFYTDDNSIQANQVYTYSIVTVNSVVNGTASAWITVTSNAPTVPLMPTVSIQQLHSGYVQMWCTASRDSGGLELRKFQAILKQFGVIIAAFEGLESTIEFARLNENSNYSVEVRSVNDLGSSNSTIVEFVTGPAEVPGQMDPPQIVSVNGGGVTLLITPPEDSGGISVSSYVFYVDNQIYSSTDQGNTQWNLYGLIAETTYEVSVSAVNAIGAGTQSAYVEVTTTDISEPGPISNVTVLSKTYNQLNIAWDAPIDTGGDTELEYEVEIKESVSGAVVFNDTTQIMTVSITDLLPETVYLISGRVLNTVGISTWSALYSVETDPISPGILNFQSQSIDVSEDDGLASISVIRSAGGVMPATCNFATLDGTAVAGVHYTFTSGMLQFPSGVMAATIAIPIANDLFIENADLFFYVSISTNDDASGTIGEIGTTRVVIIDDGDAGTIQFSNDSYYVIEADCTLTVSIIRVNGTSGSVTVLAETFDTQNVAATQGVDYLFSLTNVTFMDGETLFSLPINIYNDDIYQPSKQFGIALRGISGRALLGKWSSVFVHILDDGDVSAPGVPSNLSLTAISGSAVYASWTRSSFTGAANISAIWFSILLVSSDQKSQVLTAYNENLTISNLFARSTYNVSIAATNGHFQSNFSRFASIQIGPPTMPSAPLSTKVIWKTGGAANVSWAAPSDFGGASILLYRLLVSDTSTYRIVRSYDAYGASYVLNGLQSLTDYYVTVEAMNSEGLLGNKTESLVFTTRSPTTPGKPPSATLSKATGGAIYLNLSPSLDTGGITLGNYSVFATSASNPNIFSEVYQSSNSACVVAGLKYSTQYAFKYRVWNVVVSLIC